jgi:cytoskeletal protein CcmA (bactofilin family)
MVDPIGPSTVRIEATGATSGLTFFEDIRPIPSSSALWATSDDDDAIDVSGSPTIDGPVHSGGGIEASGSGVFENGAEYVGAVHIKGSVELDPAVQVEPGAVAPAITDFERTIADLVATVEIPASECSGGRWKPDGDDLRSGVIHVPCDVELRSSRLDGPVGATIVADGKISLSGSRIEFAASELPSLVSLGADSEIKLSGSRHVLGAVYAAGPIMVSGSKHTFTGEVVTPAAFTLSGGQSATRCGIYAETIHLSGGNSTFSACPRPPG